MTILIAAALPAFDGHPALAKTPAHCRIISLNGAAGAASFDKVTFRAVDSAGIELDRSCLNQVQVSETAQHFAERLPGDWGDGQCAVAVPTPVPPASPLNNTCGNCATGASCKHKYKLKNGAVTVRVCCYEGANCKGNKIGKTQPSRLPITVQQKKDPDPAFGPTPVPVAVGVAQVALDPIGLTQQPFGASEGCRDKLSKELKTHADTVLRTLVECHKQLMEGKLVSVDCNSINTDSDLNGAITQSRADVGTVATEKCAASDSSPARLGYHSSCPAPCAAPVGDWTQEVDCLTCLVESATTAAIADKYGTAGPGLSPLAQKCQDLIGDMLIFLTTTFDGVTVNCQKKVDGGKLGLAFCQLSPRCTNPSFPCCTGPPSRVNQICTKDDDCIDPSAQLCKYADMGGTRALATQKVLEKIQSVCDPAAINELETCGTDPGSVAACVVANAQAAADALADAKYPEGIGRTPCDSPGPLCPTPTPTSPATTPTPTLTPTPTVTVTPTPGGSCGNGSVEPGETCDPPGSLCPNAGNGLEVCNPICRCDCPGLLEFEPDAADPATRIDEGWTGFAHDQPLISDAKLTVAVTGCPSAGPGTTKPCGVCSFTGPVPNVAAGSGDIDNHRCSCDTSVTCSSNADCPGACPCQFFLGGPRPIGVGGVSVCTTSEVAGNVSGTANIETGQAGSTLGLIEHVFNLISVAAPCPRCLGDTIPNDGVRGGTCSGGARDTQLCDTSGTSPVPSAGSTSLDCPPNTGAKIADLPIALAMSTGIEHRDLSAASPNCRDFAWTASKCLCDTCNNANAEICSSNADCPPPSGGPVGTAICGGKRCTNSDGGNYGMTCNVQADCPGFCSPQSFNAGAPCTANPTCIGRCNGGANNGGQCPSGSNSACPGGVCQGDNACTALCGVPGAPTAPNSCSDHTCTPTGGNKGECTGQASDLYCGPSEIFRSCVSNFDCTFPGDTCSVPVPRPCFVDNGLVSGVVRADGQASPPVNDTWTPTFASVTCMPGSSPSGAFNIAYGIPGPQRLTLRGTMRGLP